MKFSDVKQPIEFDITHTGINGKPTLLFSLRDYSNGIPEDEGELVFYKFEQGSRANSGFTKGMGLGLSISKNIIE